MNLLSNLFKKKNQETGQNVEISPATPKKKHTEKVATKKGEHWRIQN